MVVLSALATEKDANCMSENCYKQERLTALAKLTGCLLGFKDGLDDGLVDGFRVGERGFIAAGSERG